MKKTLRINPKTHLVCIPRSMIEQGMVGNVDAFANAITLTIVSPGASLEDVRTSLETVIRDINLRLKIESKAGKGAEGG